MYFRYFTFNSASRISIHRARYYPWGGTALAPARLFYCTVAAFRIRAEDWRSIFTAHVISVSPAYIVIAPCCKIALFLAMMAIIEPRDEGSILTQVFPSSPSITAGMVGFPVPYELADETNSNSVRHEDR